MSYTPTKPSRLSLAFLFSRIASSALWRAITYPFRSDSYRAPTLRKDVVFAVIRTMMVHMSISQSRFLNASTTQRYEGFCKRRKIQPRSIEVLSDVNEEGSIVAHWLGDPQADVLVLYLHGGGYTQPCTVGYFHYWQQFLDDMSTRDQNQRSMAVLVLAYTLAPEARYPTQLKEAAGLLSYMLNEAGCSPSRIILAGDSAGGGLAISLLSHILHPHPDIAPVSLSALLCGALLISPFVSFRTDYDSFTRNATTDLLTPEMLRRFAAIYVGKTKEDIEADPGPISGDQYSEPGCNASGWWSGMHRVARDVFIWRGADEAYVDGVAEFSNSFTEGWIEGGGDRSRVLCLESNREAHVSPINGAMLDRGKKLEGQLAIEAWFRARLEK